MQENTVQKKFVPFSKPSSSQSNERRNLSYIQTAHNKNLLSTIDVIENDLSNLQKLKKPSWEDYLTKPPSSLAKKRLKQTPLQIENKGQYTEAYDPMIANGNSIKSSRPHSQGTTKATGFYNTKKGEDGLITPQSESFSFQIQLNQQKQQSSKGTSNKNTSISFYQNDTPQGLSPTKTNLIENIGKQSHVDYPNKIEGPTPKIWHPKMEDFECKGNEWQINIDDYKLDDSQKQQDKQKQIREATRLKFVQKYNNNLDFDIKIKKNTHQKIQPPKYQESNITDIQNLKHLSQTVDIDLQLNKTQNHATHMNKQNGVNTNQKSIAMSSTMTNFQRFPRQNTPQKRHQQHVSIGAATFIDDNSIQQHNNLDKFNRKRVQSTCEYGIHYDYHLRQIGQRGMFVYEGFGNKENKINGRQNSENCNKSNSNSNIDQDSSSFIKKPKFYKLKKVIKNIQNNCADKKNEVVNIQVQNEKLANCINSGKFNTNNKLFACPTTSKSERRPLTANYGEQTFYHKINQTKSQAGNRTSPYQDYNSMIDINIKPLPYNSDIDIKTQHMTNKMYMYSMSNKQTIQNSSDINVIDELDKFDEKMEEKQKMKKFMRKMNYESKGFCGITKKENELLLTAEGFKRVRAKKAQLSYPYCLSFDPF